MTDSPTATPGPGDAPDRLPGALLAPPLLQALFWTPRFLVPSLVMAHVPFLFWLTAALRPRRIGVLGLGCGAAHFAFCQALDRLGIDGRCRGFGIAPETGGDAPGGAPGETVPERIRAHETTHHKGRSRIAGAIPFQVALDRIGAGGADILFVDLAALPPGDAVDGKALMACLASPGVLVLHGTNAPDRSDAEMRRLLRNLGPGRPVEFTLGEGLVVATTGGDRALPLQALRGEAERIFRSSGEGLLATALTAAPKAEAGGQGESHSRELAEAQAALRKLRGELQAERNARFEETTTLSRLAEELRAQLAASAEPERSPGRVSGRIPGRIPGRIHVLQSDATVPDQLRGQLLPRVLQPEPGVGVWTDSDGDGEGGALTVSLQAGVRADVFLQFDLSDRNLLPGVDDAGVPRLHGYRRILLPGQWMRDRLLADLPPGLDPASLIVVGSPLVDHLRRLQAVRPAPPGPRRVLLATLNNKWPGPDGQPMSCHPGLAPDLDRIRARCALTVVREPLNVLHRRATTTEALLDAAVVVTDHTSLIFEAWALGKPVIFPRWLIADRIAAAAPGSAEAQIHRDRIGLHAGSVDELLEMIDSAEGTGPAVAAFMAGYLDNYSGDASGGGSGKWVQRLLEAMAGPG